MDFPVINKQILAKDVKRLDVEAPDVAAKALPGQFVMVAAQENSEWIPLSVVETDSRRGLITLIFQEVGPATRQLGQMPIHDVIFSVTGPFGTPATIKQFGCVVCVATGVGIAQILPVCRAFKMAGNKVVGVIGAVTKKSLILEAQMRVACHKIIITTDDGSYQRRGKAADGVKEMLTKENVKLVYSVGSLDMLEDVSSLTRDRGVKNLLQVKPVMHCGRGICGACRVKVGNKIILACEHGVEFNAHEIDFHFLRLRQQAAVKTNANSSDTKAPGFFKKLFDDGS